MRRVLTLLVLMLSASSALAQGSPRACGVERWPVRVPLDVDAPRIGTAPVRSTVALLGELRRPSAPLSRDHRIGPSELTTYRVVAAVRDVLPPENDGDIHVVLQDLEDSTRTLIA